MLTANSPPGRYITENEELPCKADPQQDDRMIGHRLSRIDRLVLEAYVDMATIDDVRGAGGGRFSLVNGAM